MQFETLMEHLLNLNNRLLQIIQSHAWLEYVRNKRIRDHHNIKIGIVITFISMTHVLEKGKLGRKVSCIFKVMGRMMGMRRSCT
jgi:hypothetical protein